MTRIDASHARVRLDFRLSADLKLLIERAASLMGQTVTEYAVSRLAQTARQDVQEHEVRVLSDRDREAFLAMLASDAEPNEAMRRAARRYKGRRASRD